MHRRDFLAATATSVALSAPGCVEAGPLGSSTGSDHTVLDPPEHYEELRASRDEGHIAFPIHGDELPNVTVPDALSGDAVTTTEFVGDRHTLFTFIFTRCSMSCPILTSTLAQAQVQTGQRDFEDEFAFLPMTFDPDHDTADILRGYSEDRGADLSADNWYFLRPESEQRAEEVVGDRFGLWYDRMTEQDRAEYEEETGEEWPENMVFNHMDSIVVANKDGYVERNYTGSMVPNGAGLLQDMEALRAAW